MKKGKLEHTNLKKNGFKVPRGYFDTVEDGVFSKLSDANFIEKKELSVPEGYFDSLEDRVLEKIRKETPKKETGFKVPPGYLQGLENAVFKKIQEDKTPVKVISLQTILLKRVLPIAAAASLALLVYMNYNQGPASIDDLASSEVEAWIEGDLLTFDSYEIAEVYSDVTLEDENVLEIEDEELLEYLDGTDIESIILDN